MAGLNSLPINTQIADPFMLGTSASSRSFYTAQISTDHGHMVTRASRALMAQFDQTFELSQLRPQMIIDIWSRALVAR